MKGFFGYAFAVAFWGSVFAITSGLACVAIIVVIFIIGWLTGVSFEFR